MVSWAGHWMRDFDYGVLFLASALTCCVTLSQTLALSGSPCPMEGDWMRSPWRPLCDFYCEISVCRRDSILTKSLGSVCNLVSRLADGCSRAPESPPCLSALGLRSALAPGEQSGRWGRERGLCSHHQPPTPPHPVHPPPPLFCASNRMFLPLKYSGNAPCVIWAPNCSG